MRKLKASAALGALGVILIAAPAIAGDTAPQETYSWTGFHIGVGGGGNFAFADEEANAYLYGLSIPYASEVKGAHNADLGAADFFGTVEGGYDFQLGSSVVLGVLANYDFGKEKVKNKSNADKFYADELDGSGILETQYEIGDSWAAGGRLGFLAMDSALLYVAGGYTSANIKSELAIGADDDPSLAYHTSDSSWEDGWFIGGGIEALLTDNISVKAEYRYNDYGSVGHDEYAEYVLPEWLYSYTTNSQNADITVHSVRAVLSYRFELF